MFYFEEPYTTYNLTVAARTSEGQGSLVNLSCDTGEASKNENKVFYGYPFVLYSKGTDST